ncbi:MAG: tetratricopeptide repeat protein, partial [Deltaproteobacteria bacterium]|nr:tetratricopeptide repeat protein [Deltaproteobacteria bacterium]
MDRPNRSDDFRSPECGRVHTMWEHSLLEGAEPSDSERDDLREHIESCAECGEFVAVLESFEEVEPLPAGTIDELLDAREQGAQRRRRNTGLLAAGLVAAAAAIALVIFVAIPGTDDDLSLSGQGVPLVATDGARWVEGSSLSTSDEPLRLHRGDELTVALDRATRAEVEALRDDNLALELRSGCLAVQVDPAAEIAVAVETKHGRVVVQGTIFAVETSDDEVRVEVVRGSVVVESPVLAYGSAEVSANQSLTIRTKQIDELGGNRRAAILALLGIEAGQPAGEDHPEAIAIRVEGENPEEQAGDKSSGKPAHAAPVGPTEPPSTDKPLETAHPLEPVPEEQLEPQPENPPEDAVAPSPGELIRVARERRVSGDWSGAAEAYQQVLSLHPGRPEAVTVLLPLAEIELEHLGRPAKALVHFSQYGTKRPNGALAEEAFYGRCAAL